MKKLLDFERDLRQLAAIAAEPSQLRDVLRHALASLQSLIPYDLAAIYHLENDSLIMVAAEGPLAEPRLYDHTLNLRAFPTIQRALELRRPIPLTDRHHNSDEGDPYDGVLNFPSGHSCMVVPLFAGHRDIGLITLDRSTCGVYPPSCVDLAGVYGQIVSLALLFAEQTQILDRYRHQLKEQNRLLREEIRGDQLALRQLRVSRSPGMQALLRQIEQVARSDMPILLHGETGTGKEVVAEAIHALSMRSDEAFIKINCAAIPEQLVESELFGHVKGSFSGAVRARPGRFATANGGTLLLDEIGDMPLSAQSKLLRVLQESTFEPVGSDESVRVNVRSIAASHRDLHQAVADGRFREDLFYRLAVFPLRIPPLRERQEDILPIADDYLNQVHVKRAQGPWQLDDAARSALRNAPWPGNVRQLVNVLERAMILQPVGILRLDHLLLEPTVTTNKLSSKPTESRPTLTFAEATRQLLVNAMNETNGKIYGDDGAAALLDLPPSTLQSKLKKYGISYTH